MVHGNSASVTVPELAEDLFKRIEIYSLESIKVSIILLG